LLMEMRSRGDMIEFLVIECALATH